MSEFRITDPHILKAELAKPGRSQADLARHLGIAQSAVNRMVNGGREIKVREVAKIEEYLIKTAPGGRELEEIVRIAGPGAARILERSPEDSASKQYTRESERSQYLVLWAQLQISMEGAIATALPHADETDLSNLLHPGGARSVVFLAHAAGLVSTAERDLLVLLSELAEASEGSPDPVSITIEPFKARAIQALKFTAPHSIELDDEGLLALFTFTISAVSYALTTSRRDAAELFKVLSHLE